MSVSDRDRAGAFWDFSATDSSLTNATASDRAGAFKAFSAVDSIASFHLIASDRAEVFDDLPATSGKPVRTPTASIDEPLRTATATVTTTATATAIATASTVEQMKTATTTATPIATATTTATPTPIAPLADP
jgi:hypothetical protein